MTKYNSLKIGDYVIANNDGDARRGEIVDLNPYNKQVCVDVGPQEFWYYADQIDSIPLNESVLTDLKFRKEINEDGSIKYSKGAFRLKLPRENDFSSMEIWYRDEHRHIMHTISLHELQNHFHEMTKVLLNTYSFD